MLDSKSTLPPHDPWSWLISLFTAPENPPRPPIAGPSPAMRSLFMLWYFGYLDQPDSHSSNHRQEDDYE